MLYFGISCQAQVAELFNNLDFTDCTTGYLWNQSGSAQLPPDGIEIPFLRYYEAQDFILKMRNADIDNSMLLIPEFSVLNGNIKSIKNAERITPIAIMEMAYQTKKHDFYL